jgi:putative PIN family toxin of toxin-antitoxin system
LLRAVLDANVFISAILRPEGPPGRIVEISLRDRGLEIILSPAIVDEVLRALAYPKLRRYLRVDPGLWFEDIVMRADLVSGELDLSGICADPDDDKYIAAAIEGRAAFVVSGDRKLPAVREYQGVRVVSPRVILGILA